MVIFTRKQCTQFIQSIASKVCCQCHKGGLKSQPSMGWCQCTHQRIPPRPQARDPQLAPNCHARMRLARLDASSHSSRPALKQPRPVSSIYTAWYRLFGLECRTTNPVFSLHRRGAAAKTSTRHFSTIRDKCFCIWKYREAVPLMGFSASCRHRKYKFPL